MKKQIGLTEKCIRILLIIVLFPLSMTQLLVSKFQLNKIKPIGKFVQVGNNQYHVNVTGEGTPTIILESGQGGCLLDWTNVQKVISSVGTVISYDRANFGMSHVKNNPASIEQYVYELRSLLDELNLKPPYIIVGHSFGGLVMRHFASQYPDDVKGLILVDSAHEDRYTPETMSLERKTQFNKAVKQAKIGYLLAPLAIPRIVNAFVGSKHLPKKEQEIVKVLGY